MVNSVQVQLSMDSSGGIEFEDYFEDISHFDNTNDFSDVVIWGTDWTLETIYKQLSKGNIDLNPKFQRRDAWGTVKKSLLVESFIIGMPVPPIILAERKSEKGKYFVIDGKQRLLTIYQFCTDDDDYKKLRLKDVKILKEIEGKTYQELDEDMSRHKDMFDNQTIRAVVVKNWPNENFLYTMFHRLNTGTLELSSQELRQALHPGEFLNFLDDATANSRAFHVMLKNDGPDSRMRDVELALRSFSWWFYHEKYSGDYKIFLDTTCRELNKRWSIDEEAIKKHFFDVENAINLAYEVFNGRPFSKTTGRYAFNRTIYEVFVHFFSMNTVREALMDSNVRKKIMKGFEALCKEERFNQCISASFATLDNVMYRFDKIQELIKEAAKIEIPKLCIGKKTTDKTD